MWLHLVESSGVERNDAYVLASGPQRPPSSVKPHLTFPKLSSCTEEKAFRLASKTELGRKPKKYLCSSWTLALPIFPVYTSCLPVPINGQHFVPALPEACLTHAQVSLSLGVLMSVVTC